MNVKLNNLKTKYSLKPVENIFILLLLMILRRRKTPDISESVNSSLNLQHLITQGSIYESKIIKSKCKSKEMQIMCVSCLGTVLRIFCNCLICVVRIKRENIIRSIYVLFLCNFIMSFQYLCHRQSL